MEPLQAPAGQPQDHSTWISQSLRGQPCTIASPWMCWVQHLQGRHRLGMCSSMMLTTLSACERDHQGAAITCRAGIGMGFTWNLTPTLHTVTKS